MIKSITIACLICSALFGCKDVASNTSTLLAEESTTEGYSIFTEESTTEESNTEAFAAEEQRESSPFDVKIDKASLELKLVDNTRVFISTDLKEWSYTVKAEHGEISEINPDSFVYSRPLDENQKEDVITIELADYDNKIQSKLIIPLDYIFDHKTIVN